MSDKQVIQQERERVMGEVEAIFEEIDELIDVIAVEHWRGGAFLRWYEKIRERFNQLKEKETDKKTEFDYIPKELDVGTVVDVWDDSYLIEFIKDGKTLGVCNFILVKEKNEKKN